MEGVNVVSDSERYRSYMAECLDAAETASDPYYRKIHVDLAASWLKLANQEDALSTLLTSLGIATATAVIETESPLHVG